MAYRKPVKTNPQRYADSSTATADPAGPSNSMPPKKVPAGARDPRNPTRSPYAR